MSITGEDTRPPGAEGRDDVVEATPESAEGCMRALALSTAADTAPAPVKLPRSTDARQPPKPDVLDAIRSLMMEPVPGHRTRRRS